MHMNKVIFPGEGRLWNFGRTHKIHKRFLTESTRITWVGKERRDNAETVHTHLMMDINNLEIRSLFTKLSLGITLAV
jgi:hypothetical protein